MIPPSLAPLAWRLHAGLRRVAGRGRVFLWPPFSAQSDLTDIHNRLCFHYGPETEVTLPVARADLRPGGDLPPHMPRYEERCRVRYVADASAPDAPLPRRWRAALRNRAVLYWKAPAGAAERRWIERMPNAAVIDPGDAEEESGIIGWIEVMARMESCAPDRRRFEAWRGGLARKSRVYLLATGPSLARFRDFDFSDGHVIGCNTVVSNGELMAHARPDAIVAADPIYHFGPSNYAARFRTDLAKAAARHPFLFIAPDVYRHVIARHVNVPGGRVCRVPLRRGAAFAPLGRRWTVAPSGNVMTLLMMPLAWALAPEIYIIGADGREPGETEFWKHDPASQLTEAMEDLRACHPAFFAKRDYAGYYEEHCARLGKQIEAIESQGGRVRSLTPSHIPALAARSIKKNSS